MQNGAPLGSGEADGTLGQVKIIEQGIAAGDRVAAQQLFDEQRAFRRALTDGTAGLTQGKEPTACQSAQPRLMLQQRKGIRRVRQRQTPGAPN